MRHSLLAAVLLFSATARADGLIDTSSIDKQVNDLDDRARSSVHDALAPGDGNKASKAKGKGRAKKQESTGLIDMSSINQQASDVTDNAHKNIQGQLQPDAKPKSTGTKHKTAHATKSKATADKSGTGVTAPSS